MSLQQPAAVVAGKTPSFNITLWEDWRRCKKQAEKAEPEDDSTATSSDDDDEVDKENERRRLEDEQRRRHDSLQTRHVLKSSGSFEAPTSSVTQTSISREEAKAKAKEEEEAALGRLPGRPTSKPQRPFLAPRPDVIVLAFSSMDVDSFVECEKEIWPELCERFPLTPPIILVATKCDLKDERGGKKPLLPPSTLYLRADSNR